MKILRATVTFKFAFPVDMLRYDSCYPATETDSNAIINSIITQSGGEIRVEKRVESKDKAFFTKARWESFGATLEILGYY